MTAPATRQPAAAEPPVTRLRPRRGLQGLDLPGLWHYRDLLWLLAKRDIQVRYKQTALGVLWAILQPLGMMVAISTLLGPITGVSDPVTLYAGLLPWTFFAGSVTAASNSLLSNAAMLQKVYFPRLIVPMASLGAPLLDYALGFAVFAGLMLWFAMPITPSLLLLPLLVASTIIAALGVGLFIAAVAVTYRDFRYTVPFLLQLLFFASPIILREQQFPDWLQPVLWLSPVGGTIGAFRAAVLAEPVNVSAWLGSTAMAGVFLVIGLLCFCRVERRFADVA